MSIETDYLARPTVWRKRPLTVEAWLWNGGVENADLIIEWIESNNGFASKHPYENMIVLGDNIAPVKPNEWVIRDQFNDFWPLADHIFTTVYQSSF